MNKQELRDEFEKWAMANFNIAPELISDFKYSFTHRLIHAETAFLKGYSLAQETIKAKDAEIERLKSTFAGYENFQREKQLEQELQKTRAQLSKAEQRIFHAPHCVTNYERNDCDCGYEQYFKDKQGEG